MKQIIPLIMLSAFFCGCAGQQAVEHIGGDMFYTKLGVPVGQGSEIGCVFAVGRIDATTVIQATSTNKVYAPEIAVATSGQGKQNSSGNAGTNAGVNVSDWSFDGSILTTGGASASDAHGTNQLLSAQGQ